VPWLSGEKGWIPALVCRCMSAVPGSIPVDHCAEFSVVVLGSCMDALCLLSKGRSTCLSDSSTGGVDKGNSNGCA